VYDVCYFAAVGLVGWSLMSLFSTNTAISETSPSRGCELYSIAMSVFVCLFVFLSALLYSSKKCSLHVTYVAVAHSSDDYAICYVVPVLSMMSCLLIMDCMGMAKAFTQCDSPGGQHGGEV